MAPGSAPGVEVGWGFGNVPLGLEEFGATPRNVPWALPRVTIPGLELWWVGGPGGEDKWDTEPPPETSPVPSPG